MTTALSIITQAYRESNLIAISGSLNTAQQNEAMAKLNWVLASALGFEVGEELTDWPIGTAGINEFTQNWTLEIWNKPEPNSRLVVSTTDDQTIFLPPMPSNGARMSIVDVAIGASRTVTIDGNGRLIEGVASVDVPAGGAAQWLFRADLGDWVKVLPLIVSDDMPFPIQYDAYFEIMVAMRLNPRMGRSMDPQTIDILQRTESKLQAEYRQYVPKTAGAVTRLSGPMSRFYGDGQFFRRGRYGWMG